MQLIFKRRLINEAMTTFFPSVLLISITFATTFFKPIYFEASLTVNLTVMLVITTLFISVMEKLPATSYLKWVEIWLIFAQLIPFTEVIFVTVLERYKEDENSPEEEDEKVRECWTEKPIPNQVFS